VPRRDSEGEFVADLAPAVMRQAISSIIPLCIAVIPWGILTGALAVQAGFSPLQAQFMSLFVFAGAAQLSAITLFSTGTPFISINLSTFVISARHLLYSMTFRQHISSLTLGKRISIGFLLTDEMFAVSEAHTRRAGYFSPLFAITAGITFYVFWNLATCIGVVAGEYFSDLESFGLDFAIVAIFIAMTFPNIRDFPVLVAILVSGAVSIMLKPLFNDSYIMIAALIGMFSAYLCSGNLESVSDRGEA